MIKKNVLRNHFTAAALTAAILLSSAGLSSLMIPSVSAEETVSADASASGGVLDTTDLVTERDLTQTADLTDAVTYTVSDGEDIHITEEGVYIITGTASNVTIYVEAADTDKVQLVLDGAFITNDSMPCIYVLDADKVFVTTSGDSTLTVSGDFVSDADNTLDAVIYSCSDLVLNGTASLTISSTDTGIRSKDDLKITGGTYTVTAGTKALSANDSVVITDGTFTLTAGTDGIHSENSDDDSLGYVYIAGGTLNIEAGDDGIHGTSVVQIDDGTITISAAEGIEGTYVQINGGSLTITASDDGINAGQKSSSYTAQLEITGGSISISMASGDTDGLDSNGNLTLTGGTISITGASAIDYDGTGTLTDATLIINGTETTTLPSAGFGGMSGEMMQNGRMQNRAAAGSMGGNRMQ